MKHLRKARNITLFLSLSLFAISCGGSEDESSTEDAQQEVTEESTAQPVAEPVKVGVILSGATSQPGYYMDNKLGADSLIETYGADVTVVENLGFDPVALAEAAKNLALSGKTIIIGDGVTGEAMKSIANDYPDVTFIVFTAPSPDPTIKNLHAYLPQQGLTSYLLGVIAASSSKSGKVGCLGGYEDNPSGQACSGFVAGAKSVNSAIKTSVVTVGSYDDPALTKSATSAMLSEGFDQIYAYVDGGLSGATQAVASFAKEGITLYSSAGSISGSTARCDFDKSIRALAFQDIPASYRSMYELATSGTLDAGTTYVGVDDSSLQNITFCPGNEDPSMQALVESAIKSIIDGTTKLDQSITGK
jgi:basic membrane protein A